MHIYTKKTGKEELITVPVTEKFEKKHFSKHIQNALKEKKHFTGKEDTELLIQGKEDILFIGIGEKVSNDTIRKVAGKTAKYAKKNYYNHYALDLQQFPGTTGAAVEGSYLGLYEYNEYKKKNKNDPKNPTHLSIFTQDKNIGETIQQSKILAESTMLVRDLLNRPASDKTPKYIANMAKELGKKYGFSVNIKGQKELEKLGMNSMLGVNRGSDEIPQLVIMEIGKGKVDMALAGKGVTFDAGGLQIKPGNYMLDMKMDMGGAATVLGTMVALARLGCDKHIIGAMGLVENLLGPKAYKPGDILTAYNGKTIEIDHTDAEGRLVLADVLSYLEKNCKPKQMIDLATLTGAAIVSLGYRVTPILGNNQQLITNIKQASEETDELVWELPLYNHYKKMMKGNISDLRNLGKKIGSGGPGTITAAAFLQNFVTDKTAWAHMDIAGTAFSYEKTDYVPLGGTGWGVRLLTNMIMKKGE